MTGGSSNFTMPFQIEDGPECIAFSLIPKRSMETLQEKGGNDPLHVTVDQIKAIDICRLME